MKIRKGFVSNSSSSSFVIVNKDPKEIKADFSVNVYKKLTPKQSKKVIKFLKDNIKWFGNDKKEVEKIKETDDLYVTNFISDECELHWKLAKMKNVFEYMAGNHGTPYDADKLNCILDGGDEYNSVYID